VPHPSDAHFGGPLRAVRLPQILASDRALAYDLSKVRTFAPLSDCRLLDSPKDAKGLTASAPRGTFLDLQDRQSEFNMQSVSP
jgi:hypothetical protein